MADLPISRVQLVRPFLQVGVDYTGPFNIYHVGRRAQRTVKDYVCIFVCMATKAVHFEVANEMTTDAFLAAWKRMVARRGCCTDLYSDCGVNFIGANRQIKEWYGMLKTNSDTISSSLLRSRVNWHFNPASAPHFGGLWEVAVKSMKFHLRRVIGQNILTHDEFHTLIVQVEGILNSRPLCRGDEDVDILTPGHFLVGHELTTIPEPIEDHNISYRERWRLVKQTTQHFWKRWHHDYLLTLQNRYKWQQKSTNIQVDDIVQIKEDSLKTTRWPIGRVIKTHHNEDGWVRSVTLRTQDGVIQRPVHKLSKLNLSESNDSRGAGCLRH